MTGTTSSYGPEEDDPQADRIALLIEELDELPADEREAAVAALSPEDREAVWAAELETAEEVGDDEEGEA